jgi:putative ABC transport system substrate-binding protein
LPIENSSTVPVVFIQVSDPVAQSFVANVTRPGGNLTGFPLPRRSVPGGPDPDR